MEKNVLHAFIQCLQKIDLAPQIIYAEIGSVFGDAARDASYQVVNWSQELRYGRTTSE